MAAHGSPEIAIMYCTTLQLMSMFVVERLYLLVLTTSQQQPLAAACVLWCESSQLSEPGKAQLLRRMSWFMPEFWMAMVQIVCSRQCPDLDTMD